MNGKVRAAWFAGLTVGRERKRQWLRSQWQTALQGSPGQLRGLPPAPPFFMGEVTELWNAAHESTYATCGDLWNRREYLNDIARRRQLPDAARTRLYDRDASVCIAAITMLGHFRDHTDVRELRALLESTDRHVSFAAARALLQITPSFAAGFVAMMRERSDWPSAQLAAVVWQEDLQMYLQRDKRVRQTS